MSKKELAIGVLGAGGNIGHTHSQNIATYVDGARLAAVYDLNTERAEEVAKTYGAKVMASAEELIASPEIDAVVIASWDGTHADLAVKCIEAGKPVFCEKPLATTLEDAKKVVEAEKASGKRLLQIGFMRRFDPDYIKMKKILDSGELGAPLMAHCISRTRSHPKNHTTEQHITNIAIHEIDICRWLLGDEYESAQVLKVRQSACSTKGYDNPQIVLLETKSGARIDVEVQVADAYGYDIQCQVVCEKGTVNLPDPYAVVKRANASRSFPILTDWKDRFIEAYDIELTHWVKTLEEKGEPDGPSAWDGYAACVAADALNRSRGTGRFLPVETMEKPELYR